VAQAQLHSSVWPGPHVPRATWLAHGAHGYGAAERASMALGCKFAHVTLAWRGEQWHSGNPMMMRSSPRGSTRYCTCSRQGLEFWPTTDDSDGVREWGSLLAMLFRWQKGSAAVGQALEAVLHEGGGVRDTPQQKE
jgi:hypothetical protein